MRVNSHGLKSSSGARRSSGGRRDVGAYGVGEAPRRGSRGASSVPATLARGGQALRRGQRQCPPNRGQRQSGLHRPPLCFSAMLTREFGVMVGLMSGKAKSAIPQNSVGSRSRGWGERLVCGSCHQLGDHSWCGDRQIRTGDLLLAKPVRPPLSPARGGNGAGRGYFVVVRGCPLGTVQDRCEWHASGTASEGDPCTPWRRWLCLDWRVRPVVDDHRLVGKSPEGSRQSHTGT
jgi:hypothetical protein